MTDPADPADFLLTTCQVGAERALKAEFARRWPELRPAYARPGFVTFKAPVGTLEIAEYANSIFARACAVSLGKVTPHVGESLQDSHSRLGETRSREEIGQAPADMAAAGMAQEV